MRVLLETERLRLRAFTMDDVDLLTELDSNPAVMHFINGGRPTPRAEIEAEYLPAWLAYYERYAGYGFWAAIERATGEFVGWFHLRPPEGTARPTTPSSATACGRPPGASGMRRRGAGRSSTSPSASSARRGSSPRR